MADTSPSRRLNTYCVGGTHDRVGAVFWQQTAGSSVLTALGTRSYNSGLSVATTVTECAGGGTNYAGPNGQPAWVQLYSTGAAPLPHPTWTPDNHDYVNFANGTSLFAGRNL